MHKNDNQNHRRKIAKKDKEKCNRHKQGLGETERKKKSKIRGRKGIFGNKGQEGEASGLLREQKDSID